MRREHIEAGDLVIMVEAHCEPARQSLLGQIHTVRRIVEVSSAGDCPSCREPRETCTAAQLLPGKFHPVAWLKRIGSPANGGVVLEDDQLVA